MTGVQRRWYPLTGPEPARRGALDAAPRAAKKRGPIDPLTGPKLALAGRVVTMDEAFTVKTNAVVYIDRGSIVAVETALCRPLPASTTWSRSRLVGRSFPA
jgi:5-methylthioadenosine/S-adenosylhomocysteine deaminase